MGGSVRRVRILWVKGKISGAYQQCRGWRIPKKAEKPTDGRYKTSANLLSIVDQKKKELDTRRPLTEREVE